MSKTRDSRQADIRQVIAFLNSKDANGGISLALCQDTFKDVDTSLLHKAAEHIRKKGKGAHAWDDPIRAVTSKAGLFLC